MGFRQFVRDPFLAPFGVIRPQLEDLIGNRLRYALLMLTHRFVGFQQPRITLLVEAGFPPVERRPAQMGSLTSLGHTPGRLPGLE